jgi:glycine/D-amino acid oxidase-like deaminating enzyme
MPFARHPRPETLASLTDAAPIPFWLDDPICPESTAPLTAATTADLVIIGAGFTGLWTALLAKETGSSRDVVLLEADEVATGASGRNGGFVGASLTHGFKNGRERWPNEISAITALGHANLDAIAETITGLQIDCDFLRSGELTVATEPYQAAALRSVPDEAAAYGETFEWLEREQILSLVNSPTYLGALYDPKVAMLNPARLAWGLRKACIELGVRLYEHTPAIRLDDEGKVMAIRTPHGRVRAKHVALATNAFPPLLKQLSHYVVPVYDYVLVTEPLHSGLSLAGRAGRASPIQGTNSTTTAQLQRAGSCGAVTTRSTIGIMDLVHILNTIQNLSAVWRNTSSKHFPSLRGYASHTPGAGPSIPARASALSGEQPMAGALHMQWAIPGSAWAHRASVRR